MRHSKLVGAVSNPDLSGSRESGQAVSTYHGTYAVRLKTAPTGGESIHLFLESTINQITDSIGRIQSVFYCDTLTDFRFPKF